MVSGRVTAHDLALKYRHCQLEEWHASFSQLISGQFGQPTVLGFAVFVSGLALTARNLEEEETLPDAAPRQSGLTAKRVVGRRSPYAARLHGPVTPRDQNNGSLDR